MSLNPLGSDKTFEEKCFNLLILFILIGMPAISLYLLFSNA